MATKKIAGQSARATDKRWDEAVDWLLDRALAVDPEIHTLFWAYVDGHIARDEMDTFNNGDVEERRAELGINR